MLGISLLALATASAHAAIHHKIPEPIGSIKGLITADDYPAQALDRNEQGNVRVLIRVDPTGAISDCLIEKSSGSTILDSRTCEVIRLRAKFKPPHDWRGVAVASEAHDTVTWRISDDIPHPSEPGASRMVIDFAPDGRAASCHLELEGAFQLAPGKAAPPCPPDAMKRDVGGETRFGGAIDRAVFEDRFSLSPIANRDLGANEALAGRDVLKLDIDATGKLSDCKVAETTGPYPTPDPCLRIHKEYVARKGPDGKPAPFSATETLTWFVHLDGKRMPLTGSLQGLIRSDDYPAEALDKNEQGRVTMLLRVNPAGGVRDCIIEKSSGFAVLDQRTCELVKQRAHFQPALDREGKPVASETRGSVVWQIGTVPSEPWVSRMVVAFDPSGRQLSCKMEFEGAAKLQPDMITPSCSDRAISLPQKVHGEMPGAVATVVIEQRFVLDGSLPPSIPQGNTLISRLVLNLDVDAKGKLSKCKAAERTGGDSQADPCDDTDTDYAVRKGPDGKPVPFKAKRATTVYLRVEKVS